VGAEEDEEDEDEDEDEDRAAAEEASQKSSTIRHFSTHIFKWNRIHPTTSNINSTH
jgi:hypothetical protein